MGYLFGGNTGLSPDQLAQRRKIAEALAARAVTSQPQNVGEGLSAVGLALASRFSRNRLDRQETEGRATGDAAFKALFQPPAVSAANGGQAAPGWTGTPAVAATGDSVSRPGGIGSEAGADDRSATDMDAMVRTVYGEANGQPVNEQQAVTEAILNRARQSGMSPYDVVHAKGQFEPWMSRSGELNSLATDSPAYKAIMANILPAMGPDDPTGGADHFYAPKAQAALGRDAPGWDNGTGRDIGDSRFFALGYDGAGAGSPATGGSPGPEQPAGGVMPAGGAGIDPQMAEALSNPWLSEGQRTVLEAMLKQRLDAGGEFFGTPVYGEDADGNPIVLQLGKGGKINQPQLPPGVSIAPPGMQVRDLGTSMGVFDRSGDVVNSVPIDVSGKAREAGVGEAQGAAIASMPKVLQQAETALAQISAIKSDPNRVLGTGASAWTGALPGSMGTRDFANRVAQLKGQAFLSAFESLKGGGAITNIEGDKATEAIARLDRAGSEEGFLAALNDLESVLKAGIERAKQRAGQTPITENALPQQPTPQATPATGNEPVGTTFDSVDQIEEGATVEDDTGARFVKRNGQLVPVGPAL